MPDRVNGDLFLALEASSEKETVIGSLGEIDNASIGEYKLNQTKLDRIQRRKLRAWMSKWIMWMLLAELSFVFVMVFLLLVLWAFKLVPFPFNEWMFGVFVNGVILQTFLTVRIIVTHLFPMDKDC